MNPNLRAFLGDAIFTYQSDGTWVNSEGFVVLREELDGAEFRTLEETEDQWQAALREFWDQLPPRNGDILPPHTPFLLRRKTGAENILIFPAGASFSVTNGEYADVRPIDGIDPHLSGPSFNDWNYAHPVTEGIIPPGEPYIVHYLEEEVLVHYYNGFPEPVDVSEGFGVVYRTINRLDTSITPE